MDAGSPLSFLLYRADIPIVAVRHAANTHSYADDTQLYVRIQQCRLTLCVSEIAAGFKVRVRVRISDR